MWRRQIILTSEPVLDIYNPMRGSEVRLYIEIIIQDVYSGSFMIRTNNQSLDSIMGGIQSLIGDDYQNLTLSEDRFSNRLNGNGMTIDYRRQILYLHGNMR